MNKKRFLEYITHNYIAKIVCFITALFIFFFYQTSRLEKKTLNVPLTVKSYSNMTASTDLSAVRYVKVSLKGNKNELAGITENDVEAYVDISTKSKAGTYYFPVYIQKDERLLHIEPLELITEPEAVKLTIEEEIFRYVPISVSVAGEPSYGYENAGITYLPTTVKVTGPKSIVDDIESIQTEKADIDGISKNTEIAVYATNKNRLITVDTKTPINVSVAVTALPGSRSFKSIKIGYANIHEELQVANSSYSLMSATVEGTLVAVEKLKESSIVATVDCSSVTEEGTYTLPVYVYAPSGIQVSSQTVEAVSVEFVKKVDENDLEEG